MERDPDSQQQGARNTVVNNKKVVSFNHPASAPYL